MRQINSTATAKSQPAPIAQPVEDIPIPEAQRRTILTLTGSTCRWPIGDPAREEFYFCGGASQVGQPYCPHHAQMAFQPLQSRRR